MTSATDLRFLGDWGVLAGLVLAGLLAFAAWKYYRRETVKLPGRAAWLLPALRSAAVFLVVLMLTGPVLHHRKVIGELARVLVFVDASQSMAVTDDFMNPLRKLNAARARNWIEAGALPTNIAQAAEAVTNNPAFHAAVARFDGLSRWLRAETMLLDDTEGMLPVLAKKHNVELHVAGGPAGERLWTSDQRVPPPKTFTAKPATKATDLASAINERIGTKSEERVAVVLFSDGAHNQGVSPVEVAKIAASRNIPIFTVGLGGTERPGDLAVMDVASPEAVFVEDRVKGEIALKDDMPPGQPFMVRIESLGKTVWEKSLVTDGSHLRQVEFDFPVKELAEERKKAAVGYELSSVQLALDVKVTALDGEKETSNNTRPLHLRAVSQKRKMLLLDGRPRWEFRYLRNMFERDPQWEVHALTGGTELRDEWPRGNGPGKFPNERDLLFSYDLIGFGEVPVKMLTETELTWIREFVGARGGGLFFVDGRRGLLQEHAHDPLGAMLPVEWVAKAGAEKPQKLLLTQLGMGFGPLRLKADPAQNQAAWQSLPAPHWVAATKALPGAETLVEAAVGGQNVPAVVLRPFGAGRVLYVGTEDLWRWRFKVADQYHEPFWRQMANAIMEAPYAAHDRHVELDAGAGDNVAGRPVSIRVRLRNDEGRIVSDGVPVAMLYRDGAKIASIPLAVGDNKDGIFRGRTAPLEPGDYELRVDAQGLVTQDADMRMALHVRDRNDAAAETANLGCNEELLQQVARASGGEYYREEDAANLLGKLEPLSKGRVEESETVLWQSWWWFIPVIGLLTIEWLLRKRAGLI